MTSSTALVVPIFAAFVTGIFAIRNAAKKPADRLKILLESRKELGDYDDPESTRVLDAAIALEVEKIRRATEARHHSYFRAVRQGCVDDPFFWVAFVCGLYGVVLQALVFLGYSIPGTNTR